MLRYNGDFKPTDNMIKAIEYCEKCLKFCEDIFIQLNNQEHFTMPINDKSLMEQIKQAQNIGNLEETARNNSLLDDLYNKRLLKFLIMDFCIYMGQSKSYGLR